MNISDEQKIETLAAEMDQVFSLGDLRVLFHENTDAGLYKRLNRLEARGFLVKIIRGYYARPAARLERICQRVQPDACLTAGTVLARELLIGTVPARSVQAIRVGRPRTYETPFGNVRILSVKPTLYSGFAVEDGLRYALPEKAFLDACYFTYKGHRFPFDPATDVDMSRLDAGRLRGFLPFYDRRFLRFYERIWGLP